MVAGAEYLFNLRRFLTRTGWLKIPSKVDDYIALPTTFSHIKHLKLFTGESTSSACFSLSWNPSLSTFPFDLFKMVWKRLSEEERKYLKRDLVEGQRKEDGTTFLHTKYLRFKNEKLLSSRKETARSKMEKILWFTYHHHHLFTLLHFLRKKMKKKHEESRLNLTIILHKKVHMQKKSRKLKSNKIGIMLRIPLYSCAYFLRQMKSETSYGAHSLSAVKSGLSRHKSFFIHFLLSRKRFYNEYFFSKPNRSK